MIKVKYSIIQDKWEDDLPTYYILKSTYIFGFNFCGEIYGVDGLEDKPFLNLESAKDYLKLKQEL